MGVRVVTDRFHEKFRAVQHQATVFRVVATRELQALHLRPTLGYAAHVNAMGHSASDMMWNDFIHIRLSIDTTSCDITQM